MLAFRLATYHSKPAGKLCALSTLPNPLQSLPTQTNSAISLSIWAQPSGKRFQRLSLSVPVEGPTRLRIGDSKRIYISVFELRGDWKTAARDQIVNPLD